MSDRADGARPSRRIFLKGTAASLGVASLSLESCGESSESASEPTSEPTSEPASHPSGDEADGPLFTRAERQALSVLADRILPGAGAWGAVHYIERTLTLFEHDPPRLYAGTVGSTDEWLPFDRVRERAWRLRIHGSDHVPYENEAILGGVRGHRPVIVEGARVAAEALAKGASPGSVWDDLSDEFRDVFIEWVLEGSLGDPIYGGNLDGAAWRAFHFDTPILGYAGRASGSHAHEAREEPSGDGPDPLRLTTRIALWIMGFFSRRIA